MKYIFFIVTVHAFLTSSIAQSEDKPSQKQPPNIGSTFFITPELKGISSTDFYEKIFTNDGVYVMTTRISSETDTKKVEVPLNHALVLFESLHATRHIETPPVWSKANVSLHLVATSEIDFAPESPDQLLRKQGQIKHRLHKGAPIKNEFLRVLFPRMTNIPSAKPETWPSKSAVDLRKAESSLILHHSLPSPALSFTPQELADELDLFLQSSKRESSGEQIHQRFLMHSKRKARKYLVNKMKRLGYGIEIHEVRSKAGPIIGHNIIATRLGKNRKQEEVLVTAHYDTMQNAPGADDNGTGVVALLKLAKAFSKKPISRTLRFVLFDLEEIGMLGSKDYAAKRYQDLDSEIVAVFNFEMLGFDADNDRSFHAISCDLSHSNPIIHLIKTTLTQMETQYAVSNACTNRSDHASFWQFNIPATVVSQNFFGGDSNPCYHKACDKIDKVDFEYFSGLLGIIANSISKTL